MILLLDHDDSFVHTLASYVALLGVAQAVKRVGSVALADVERMAPSHLILSPGPGHPDDYPDTLALIRALAPTTPLLGVCLGHQCIAAAFGGVVRRAGRPQHGMTSEIEHDGIGVFAGLPTPFTATRYHSLAVERESLPEMLQVTATSGDGEIMGIRHAEYRTEGVQFHPESVLTEWGREMIRNFVGNR